MYDVILTRTATISEVNTGISYSVIQMYLLNYGEYAGTLPLYVETLPFTYIS
jgi:hypothetical protein